ncbi:putative methyltransferase domain containing protein [Lyophyllum shimeji]|uniref:Methyltransferase domain containing protein n=1 Tax=Lyophyllum shimeji TaxID=47721 RepID=A0A9P3PUU3_LYOSH|nr:putative methyltransferase domain containing protein [Lyophyllum shimeji]
MLQAIHDVLRRADVQQLLAVHPNDPQADHIDGWPPWRTILDDYRAENPAHPLLASIRAAQLPRDPIELDVSIAQSTFGMSPKKHHEVSRMTQYIVDLVRARLPDIDAHDLRIVDVGAGQGYLTRALHAHFQCPTLALDSDTVQTHGAVARGGPTAAGITHRTIHITPSTLIGAVDDWLPTTAPSSAQPPSVLLVALHACGTLTPDIFRAVLALPPTHSWRPAAVIAVGCCYNLMTPPHDFPLSTPLRLHPHPLPAPLPASAYQMAAQIPDHWLDSPARLASAQLAIRKVVWRALLGRRYARICASHASVTETGSTPAMRRLGRLHDDAYASWPAFLERASERIGVDFSSSTDTDALGPESELATRLESLHVLRCLLGPVVESYIVLDRVTWLEEELDRRKKKAGDGLAGYEIEAVNLFDQATGSGRNIALVLAPPAPSHRSQDDDVARFRGWVNLGY